MTALSLCGSTTGIVADLALEAINDSALPQQQMNCCMAAKRGGAQKPKSYLRRAGGNTREAPSLANGWNRKDNRMIAERKLKRTDVGWCLDRLNASCWIVDLYRRVRDVKMDRHVVLAAQPFIPHDQLECTVAAL